MGIGSKLGHVIVAAQAPYAALLRRADGIWFDAWDAMRAEAGDLLQPMAAGLLPESALSGELGALLLGIVRR